METNRFGLKLVVGRVLATGAVAIALLIGIANTAAAEDWAQFQKDQIRSGMTSDSAPTVSPAVAWRSFTVYWSTHGIDVTPIVVNDKVIVIDCREKVWAFDIHSGAEIWSVQLTEGGRYTLGTPAAGEGKIFCATDSGYIYALDEFTGNILWSGGLTSGVNQEEELNTQVTYADGRVYVGSWEGIYYCLDAGGNGSSPHVDWAYDVSGTRYDWYSAAAVIGDFVLFGNTAGVLACLNKATGALVSSLDLSSVYGIAAGSIRSGISTNAAQSRIYLTSANGYVYAIGFDASTGQFDTGDGWFAPIDSYSQSTPAVYDGKVYVASGDFTKPGALYCFDDAAGARVWRYSFGSFGSAASPAISVQNGIPYIYVTTNSAYDTGGVYCFDASGLLLWEYIPEPDLNEMMLQGVAISSGKVFFGNDAGWLFALESPSAHPAWDINEDGATNYLDMLLTGNRHGESGPPGWIPEDVNVDGTVNYLDMVVLGAHYRE